jgi:spoIIIJ-associated protein
MQLDEKKKLIEDTTKELLEKMGFKATVYTSTTIAPESEGESPISVEIQLNDSKYLIGKYGVNLSAIQHLLRILVRKRANEDERIDFNVDVNGYRQEQRHSIVLLAKESAEKAFKEKKVVVLRPMNAFERRLIHVELADFEGIKTESIGEGEDRKVAIKPISLSEELDL